MSTVLSLLLLAPGGAAGIALGACRQACSARRPASTPLVIANAIGADGLGAMLPPPDDLSDEVMLKIVLQETADADVNALVWKYLGYRYNEETDEWDSSAVFPNWRKKYPQPPDLVGVTRTYSREVDEPVRPHSRHRPPHAWNGGAVQTDPPPPLSLDMPPGVRPIARLPRCPRAAPSTVAQVLRAVQSLQKSVPTEHKDNLRQCLRPLGWKGFKMEGLTPNMTRRAQATPTRP